MREWRSGCAVGAKGQRHQLLQIGNDVLIKPDCPVVIQTAMHHPMTGGHDFDVAGAFFQPAQDVAQGAGMIQRRTARPFVALVIFPPGRVLT